MTFSPLAAQVSIILTCGLGTAIVFASEQVSSLTVDEISSSYDAGYELGINLALLKKQQPKLRLGDAISGFCKALTETGNDLDAHGLCKDIPAVENAGTFSDKQQPVQRGGNRSLDDYATLNARREGVVVLPSTVQFEVIKKGTGNSPSDSDTVFVNYQASLPDGRVFDTTYDDKEPVPLMLNDIASPGLREALLMMQVGDQWRVVIPPKMGFGRSGNNRLRRHVLIYEIELVSIE